MGTSASVIPTDCARRSRKASLNRASVNVLASATTTQNALPRRPICARESGERTGASSAGRLGSRTANTITANDRNAGPTANQNTSVKLSDVSIIRPMAASGPMKAPIVSSDWQPKARAAQGGRRDVGDQRVARRAADALADAVDETCREQPADRGRQRKDR